MPERDPDDMVVLLQRPMQLAVDIERADAVIVGV
jgi:hypothetical protein